MVESVPSRPTCYYLSLKADAGSVPCSTTKIQTPTPLGWGFFLCALARLRAHVRTAELVCRRSNSGQPSASGHMPRSPSHSSHSPRWPINPRAVKCSPGNVQDFVSDSDLFRSRTNVTANHCQSQNSHHHGSTQKIQIRRCTTCRDHGRTSERADERTHTTKCHRRCGACRAN